MFRVCVFLLMLFVISSASAEELVGAKRSHFSAIRLNGVLAFSENIMLLNLVANREYTHLSAPHRPIAPLVEYLEKRIKSIYQHRGFKSTLVTSRLTPYSIDIDIREGEQLKLGRLVISNNQELSEKEILEGIKEIDWWKQRRLALDQLSTNQLIDKLEKLYENAGIFGSQFAVSFKQHQGVMDLLLEIKEGQRQFIEAVELTGQIVDDIDWVKQVIGFNKGMAFNEQLKESIIHDLQMTGRFVEVKVYKKETDPGKVRLVLHVNQDKRLPPRDEVYETHIASIKKTVAWLNQMGENDASVSVIYRNEAVGLNLKVRFGQNQFYAHLRHENKIDTVLLIDQKSSLLIDRIKRRKVSMMHDKMNEKGWGINLMMKLSGIENQDKFHQFNGGADFSAGSTSAMNMKLTVMSYVFYSAIFNGRYKVKDVPDGMMLISDDKILDFYLKDNGKAELDFSYSTQSSKVEVEIKSSQLKRDFTKIIAATSDYSNVTFFEGVEAFLDQLEPLIAQAISSTPGIDDKLGLFLASSTKEIFKSLATISQIDWEANQKKLILSPHNAQNMQEVLANFSDFIRAGAIFVPQDCWLQITLWHLPVFLQSPDGKHRYFAAVNLVKMLQEEKAGPMASLLLASIIRHPKLRGMFCQSGMMNVGQKNFQSDIAPLLTKEVDGKPELWPFVRAYLIKSGKITKDFTAEQALEKVSEIWSPELQKMVIRSFQALMPDSDRLPGVAS